MVASKTFAEGHPNTRKIANFDNTKGKSGTSCKKENSKLPKSNLSLMLYYIPLVRVGMFAFGEQ